MKQIWGFIREYFLFAIAVGGATVALALDLAGFDTLAHWVLIGVMAFELAPLLWGMIQDVRHGTYGVDILAATAIITAIVMQEYWAGMVIVLMLTGGEALEDYAEHRARKELDALLTRAPQKARVLRGRKEIEVRVTEVHVGDKLIIKPGEVVPVDAVVIDGIASFDESSLTGESLPQVRKAGETLLSGSINLDGSLTAQALHTSADSQYEQIVKLVRAAAKSKAPFVRMADRYAIPFTIVSFAIAIAAWVISGDSLRFLQVLVVATPCPLILAAPIAIISGMSRAAKHGIIIKTGSALERLAMAKTFAFDKTGTLTKGQPKVNEIKTFNKFTKNEVLALAAGLEKGSNHVLAQAIVDKALSAKVKLQKVKHVRELAGNGLLATVGGKQVVIGRSSMMSDYDVEQPASFNLKEVQSTAAFVAIDGKLAGIITFTDELRPETTATLERLRGMGIRDMLMVTGDNKATAKAIAKQTGISHFHAEALPGDKIHFIEEAAQRPVAFVGDGVNDAPVLTASDVGIALGARGTTAASESADVVVMLDDLGRVADARQIATHTFSIARQSILIGVGLSVILMLIFSTGKFKPIYGAAIQEVVDIVVILNALRAHGSWRRPRVVRRKLHASS
jgi:heavy metal translocating P-type ATPase